METAKEFIERFTKFCEENDCWGLPVSVVDRYGRTILIDKEDSTVSIENTRGIGKNVAIDANLDFKEYPEELGF